jgi:nicotinamide-nucleotide amidase
MRVEVIAIGSELLAGNVVNSNAAFISKELFKIGIPVDLHLTITDAHDTIKETLTRALKSCDLVITTGGLGPTVDDISREAIAEAVNGTLKMNDKVLQDLKKRYGDRLPNIENQALIPDNAEPLLNTVGTAPGLIIEKDQACLIVLQGVPVEMKEMMQTQVVPYLKKKYPVENPRVSKEIYLHSLREADIDPAIRELQKNYPDLSFGVYPHVGTITVRITCSVELADKAEKILNEFKEQYPGKTFPAASIAQSVQEALTKKGSTLALAESCTGGSLAAELTRHAGASDYFLGSIVAYSNRLKTALLDIPEDLLEDYGAVSKETVSAMIEGIMKKTGCDYGIAVTGIAGPGGGTKEKPVGTIWCAVAKKNMQPHIWMLELRGNREANITRTVNLTLGKLLELL